MLVDLVCGFGELVGDKVHEILHEVTLGHEEVLADVGAVAFKLILGEQDVQQLLVCLLVCCLHPLLQLVNVKVMLLSLEGGLE